MDDNKLLVNIGARLKELRLQKGISQKALASLCGLQIANLSRIESGKTNFSILTLKKIADALETPVHLLIEI